MLPTIELCEGCQREYHKAYLTDDGVRLCDGCYIELLKSELSKFTAKNAILNKYLKHARDDKKIRLGEIEGLEAERDALRTALGSEKEDLFNAGFELEGELAELQEATHIIEDEKAIQSNSDEFVILSLTVEEWRRIRDARQGNPK